MNRYILLRDNQESGPYTLREVKSIGLLTTDLIWIEGKSTSWKYPSEIPVLRSSINTDSTITVSLQNPKLLQKENQSLSKTASNQPDVLLMNAKTSGTAFPYEKDEQYHGVFTYQKKRRGNYSGQFHFGPALMGFTVLAISATMIVVMAKKAIENLQHEPMVSVATAREITSEKLPVNTAAHAAKASEPVLQNMDTVTVATNKPVSTTNTNVEANALRKETTVTTKENIARTTLPVIAEGNENFINAKSGADNNNAENVAKATEEKNDEKPVKEEEKTEKRVNKGTLQIVANDYKVGVFGGIKNLELLLTNPSTQVIDKASVEIQYLKPNGKAVHVQQFDVFNIDPGSTKKIPIPDNSRGVSIRYRVVNISAHSGKVASKDM